jgi:hypothetical protein
MNCGQRVADPGVEVDEVDGAEPLLAGEGFGGLAAMGAARSYGDRGNVAILLCTRREHCSCHRILAPVSAKSI